MWCVQWQAVARPHHGDRPIVRRGGWHEQPGRDLSATELARGRLSAAMRAARCASAGASRSAVRPLATSFDLASLPDDRQDVPIPEKIEPVGTPDVTVTAGPVPSVFPMETVISVVAITEPASTASDRSDTTLTPPGQLEVGPPESLPGLEATSLLSGPDSTEHRKLRLLQLRLDETLEAGQRFRRGSPKFRRHQDFVAALRQEIASLATRLGGARPRTADQLVADRRAVLAELAAHEKRGAPAADGARRFLIYAARRQALLADLARLDRQLNVEATTSLVAVPVPVAARPAATGVSAEVLEILISEREGLAADLALHERTGVTAQDDPRARTRFAARQAELSSRLARADAKLAHARALARTTE